MTRETALAVVALLALCGGCKSGEEAKAPPPMDVQVVEVVQKDVPVFQEWIGTLSGYINAVIRPQVKGYLLTKAYEEGSVRAERAAAVPDRPARVPGAARPGGRRPEAGERRSR